MNAQEVFLVLFLFLNGGFADGLIGQVTGKARACPCLGLDTGAGGMRGLDGGLLEREAGSSCFFDSFLSARLSQN